MAKASALQTARELDALGFNVLPAQYKGRSPTVPWKQYQNLRTTEQLSVWFGGTKPRNYWVACGRISSCIVLDIDSDEADAYWRRQLGEQLEQTTCVKTARGHHFYFRIDPDDAIASWSHHDPETDLHWDVRADGGGVIVPPSTHETGISYEWVRGPECMLPCPPQLRGVREHDVKIAAKAARSMLAQLLENPAAAGGRNLWMSRVAGHYASQYRNLHDAYLVHCEIANSMLVPPMSDAEFEKTITSIWETEQRKDHEQLQQATFENGYLLSGGDRILCPVKRKVKDGEDARLELIQWANVDIRALGVVDEDDKSRSYDVEIHRSRQQDVRTAILPADILADNRRLAGWLAQYGAVILPPSGEYTDLYRNTGQSSRIQAYLEAQNPPHFRVVESMGWNGHGFVCHEGLIRADGLHGFEGAKPNPKLRKRGEWRYGFMDLDEARRVLNEVLSFHHSQVAGVFGAWWAACLLKPQLMVKSSQFPFMALEAPSESGKTTGMFSKLVQLAGNAQGQTSYTMASMRNALGVHQSGIVWVDDEDSLSHLTQLLRIATGEGSYTKMAEDHDSSVTVQLVAPILVSGEALQMGNQKALRDRAILLEVPSPTKRRSLHDPSRPQWDDIVALTTQYPDLTCMAGSMVQLALQQAEWADKLSELKGVGGSRWGDKIAILRVGARVLAGMSGDPGWVDVVDRWVDEQFDTGAENTLTLKILPITLAALGWPSQIEAGERGFPPTPAVVIDDDVWFSPTNLAEWWRRQEHGRVEDRTETADALLKQAEALGPKTKKRMRVLGRRDLLITMWRLPIDVGLSVVARSKGEGRDSHGVSQEAF